MFARNVTLRLQANHQMQFIQAYEQHVLSLLKAQQEDADGYHNSGYK